MFQQIRSWFRRRRYRAGRTISQFIAKDVRRDVEILSVDRLEDGFVTARVRTANILYERAGLVPVAEFDPPREIALVDLWHWTGQPWGGLPDGTSLVGTHRIQKKAP